MTRGHGPSGNLGGQIFLVVLLVLFTSIATGLLVYGMVADDGGLAILGMSISIPMFLALTVNVVMLFDWPGKR